LWMLIEPGIRLASNAQSPKAFTSEAHYSFQSYYLTTFSRHTKKSPGNPENSTISPTAHFMFKLPSAGYRIIVVYPEGKDQ